MKGKFWPPGFNLAVEYCGLYWHSEVGGRKERDYHRKKYDLCTKAGIRLITVFEDEYINNKDKFFEIIDSFEHNFDDPKEFATARKYIEKFFVVIENNSEFRNKIISAARTK